jgi:ParB-like chromosome segregation protein Spo0J
MQTDLAWTAQHPVSSVQWVPAAMVVANDYNPNSVAPAEMALLQVSIEADGFTQPIVTWMRDGIYEVVDGFHRHKVGKKLGLTHLPVVVINDSQSGKGDRMASTVRHNRARGKHAVSGMCEIVQELSRRNWSEAKIGKELGMEPDEVLRLKQIGGIASLFENREFSEAWELVGD